jgi:DNA-binding CsgD family transcriptional regulator
VFDMKMTHTFESGAPPWPPELTSRQRECLRWVAQGKSSGDIGAILGLSPRTVDDHLNFACQRLGVRTRVQAAIAAIALGLIETAPDRPRAETV